MIATRSSGFLGYWALSKPWLSSKRTIYSKFRSKDEIVLACLRRLEMGKTSGPPVPDHRSQNASDKRRALLNSTDPHAHAREIAAVLIDRAFPTIEAP